MKTDEAGPAEVGLRTLVVALVRAEAGGDLVGPLDEVLRWVAEALQRRMGFRIRGKPRRSVVEPMATLTVQAPLVKPKQAPWAFGMSDSFLLTQVRVVPTPLVVSTSRSISARKPTNWKTEGDQGGTAPPKNLQLLRSGAKGTEMELVSCAMAGVGCGRTAWTVLNIVEVKSGTGESLESWSFILFGRKK